MIALVLAAAAAVQVSGHPAKASASSTLASRDARRYAPANAFDGDPATAWVEGAKGPGEGETLVLELDRAAQLDGFVLVAGYARSIDAFLQNAAPRKVEISADGKKLLDLEIPWVLEYPEDGQRCRRTPAPLNLAPRLVVLSQPVSASKLELRIAEVSAGGRFEDTAVSEWRPLFSGAATDAARAALLSIRDGKPLLAPDARADALPPWPGSEHGMEFPGYQRFLAQRLGGAQLPPAQAFLRALSPELLDHAVLVDGPRLLGGMAFTHGDGEWNELYPELVLDAQGRIAELRKAFHTDGAPGCRRALPPSL